VQGASPKELAPELFKVARYKRRSVKTELKNSNWIKNMKEVSSESHLEDFILFLWPWHLNLFPTIVTR
jgi:hypothetical protein